MLANANPLEAVPASRSVREFIAVCARHNVPYGDLNCLPTLLRELNANKHFAMHFWSVVAKQPNNGAEPVLTSVIQAVTGRTPAEVREAGPAHRILMDRLERLLAGQDVSAEETAPTVPVPTSATDKVTTNLRAEHADTPQSLEEDEHVLPIRRVTYSKGRRGRRRDVGPEPVVPTRNVARDANMRLVLLPDTPSHETVTDSSAEPLLSRSVRPQLNSAPPIPVPLSGYAEEEPRRSFPTGLLAGAVALVAIGAGGYLFVHEGGNQTAARLGASVRTGFDSAIAAWNGEPAQSAAAAPPPPADTAASAVSPESPAPTSPAPTQRASGTPTAAPQQTQADRITTPRLTPAQAMAATAAHNQQRNAVTTDSNGVVHVPENVMNAHLIASRVPVLPDDARQAGITGVVRIQATINRSGYVSRMHVLQGPTELRFPALTAVSAWRYRPYTVDGQPVDAMTTITVDFSSLE